MMTLGNSSESNNKRIEIEVSKIIAIKIKYETENSEILFFFSTKLFADVNPKNQQSEVGTKHKCEAESLSRYRLQAVSILFFAS